MKIGLKHGTYYGELKFYPTKCLPGDTKLLPGDTKLLPSDTKCLPIDTKPFPSESILLPSRSGGLPGDTKVLPGDTKCRRRTSLLQRSSSKRKPRDLKEILVKVVTTRRDSATERVVGR